MFFAELLLSQRTLPVGAFEIAVGAGERVSGKGLIMNRRIDALVAVSMTPCTVEAVGLVAGIAEPGSGGASKRRSAPLWRSYAYRMSRPS